MAMTLQQQSTNDDHSAPLSPASEQPATAPTSAPASPSLEASETPKSPIQSTTSNITAAANAAKRKPSRRANTAERRATHNAVERQRRETLNSRFLDLAALLPNLSQIRRPSKSSIVNSSIAHIHASRRHRMLASREVRLLQAESNALRRELNEWRDRAGLPRVEEPIRSEGFAIVVNGEMDAMMVSAEMGQHHGISGHMGSMDEDLEDGDDDWGMPGNGNSAPNSAYPKDEGDLLASAPYGQMPPHHQQQQQQAGFGPSSYGGYHQGFGMEDERPGKVFAHNIPHRSPMVGYESAQGPGALFTPPVSRDGPITLINTNTNGGGSQNGSVSGGASPVSVHSGASASPEMHASHGRSMSGSPTGFSLNPHQPQQRRTSNGSGGASPSYELGYSNSSSSYSGSGNGHSGSMGGMMHGYHMGGMGMGMGMGGGMGGYGGHGHGAQHGGHGQMVPVGAGAMGGVFGMML